MRDFRQTFLSYINTNSSLKSWCWQRKSPWRRHINYPKLKKLVPHLVDTYDPFMWSKYPNLSSTVWDKGGNRANHRLNSTQEQNKHTHTHNLPAGALTSFSVSPYSFTLSTATMLVSSSEDIRTSQFKDVVTCEKYGTSKDLGVQLFCISSF